MYWSKLGRTVKKRTGNGTKWTGESADMNQIADEIMGIHVFLQVDEEAEDSVLEVDQEEALVEDITMDLQQKLSVSVVFIFLCGMTTHVRGILQRLEPSYMRLKERCYVHLLCHRKCVFALRVLVLWTTS